MARKPGRRLSLSLSLSPPNVVVTDIFLPVLDGFSLCRQIKRDPRTSAIAVIGVTGYTRPGYLEEAKEAGFDAFLLKPVPVDALAARIRESSRRTG